MPLKLNEVTTDAEFGPIVAAEHEAYSKPFNGFWEILKGPSQDECCARQLSWHKSDPTSHWLYVTDTDTKEVIGGMQWNIHETNPYANGPTTLPAYWWPEGNLKQISDQFLTSFFGGRPSRMSKPHLCKIPHCVWESCKPQASIIYWLADLAMATVISYCFVHSAHRHRGAASLMMEWGTKKADEMGLESFVESTEDGQGLYESHGFQVLDDIYIDAETKEPNEEFSRLRKDLGCPIHGLYMWRPKGGKKGPTHLN